MKKLLLVALGVVGSFFLFAHGAEAAGLRAYYPLDGDINDASGNGYNLTPGNAGVYPVTYGSGLLDGSASSASQMSGTLDSGIVTCSDVNMDWNDVFSVSTWVNSTSTQTGRYLFSAYCNTHGKVNIYHNGTSDIWAWTGAGAHYLTSSINLTDGANHLVVVTGDGTNLRLFVDGTLRDTDTQDQDTSGAEDALSVGGAYNSGNEWTGLQDDVAVWDDTLQESEVDALWNNGDGTLANAAGGGGGTVDGFSFVQFEPSLFGRTLQDFSYYSVRYSSPDGENALPLWLRVEVSTSSDFSSYADNSSVNVWTYDGLQNLPKDPLANGAYYSRITLSTSSDSDATMLGRTTGSFNINSSSTDTINCTTGGANPGCSNGPDPDTTASSTTNTAINALNCAQYAFIETYDAYITDFPFFAYTAPKRVGCEIVSLIYQGGQVLIIPGKVLDGRGAVTSQLTEFKTVLPFVLYFGTIDAVQNGLNAGASTTPTTLGFLYPATYNADMLNPDTMTSFTVISTTTLTDFLQRSQYCDLTCANSIKETYFDWMRVIIWIGTGLLAIGIIL